MVSIFLLQNTVDGKIVPVSHIGRVEIERNGVKIECETFLR